MIKERIKLYFAWRLLFAGFDTEWRRGNIWEIWNAAKTVSEGTQISKISILVVDWKADGTSESDWSGEQRTGGNAYGTDGGKTGCNRRIKGTESDEVDQINE